MGLIISWPQDISMGPSVLCWLNTQLSHFSTWKESLEKQNLATKQMEFSFIVYLTFSSEMMP